ncbi:MAG: 28S ribosomal protein S5, mitochondrial [Cirrosporium novae-zelandiae]|nr:MAG: 28S ribosomal protein S5, mitochondrial [Cirrosporium novae-zelandiae]
MRSSKAARCLFCQFSRPLRVGSRQFHSSPSNAARRRVKAINIKASDMGIVASAKNYPAYSSEEKRALPKKYTPAQLAAIEAGEAAIDPDDIATQGTFRGDNFALDYLDDLTKIDPVIDKQSRAPETNHDPNWRFKTGDELTRDVAKFYADFPEHGGDRALQTKFLDNLRFTVGKEESELNPPSYEAPELPKFADLKNLKITDDSDDLYNSPMMKRLMKEMGFDERFVKSLRITKLVMKNVSNQTHMGKIHRQVCISVAGNQKGLLGIGEGKGIEAEDAIRQSVLRSIRNMKPIHRYENRTIYGDVEGKVGAVELKLMNRPPGFGLRCQRYIFEMCRCAGISDLAARITRSRNPMNIIKATFEALTSQRLPEDIARARGYKLVDVRKVYYDGNL